ncbi:hypothetical protein BS78_02G351300, partial [Paspalum vaginatum]
HRRRPRGRSVSPLTGPCGCIRCNRAVADRRRHHGGIWIRRRRRRPRKAATGRGQRRGAWFHSIPRRHCRASTLSKPSPSSPFPARPARLHGSLTFPSKPKTRPKRPSQPSSLLSSP